MTTETDVTDAVTAFADRENVVCIAANDVGSRAYGLADADSDYDVRAVVAHHPNGYGLLEGVQTDYERDVGDVEIAAWDVRKFCELLRDSDPSTLEFWYSPVCYQQLSVFETFRGTAADPTNPIASYHHYRGMAESQFYKYLVGHLLRGTDRVGRIVGEEPDAYVIETDSETRRHAKPLEEPYRPSTTDRVVKRNLYSLRASLIARYVVRTHEMPPLRFDAFLDELDAEHATDGWDGVADDPTLIPTEAVETARELSRQKRAGGGSESVGRVVDERVLPPKEVDGDEHAEPGVSVGSCNEFLDRCYDIAREQCSPPLS